MKQLNRKEVTAYSLSGLGQNMVYALSLIFLMYFYNYVFGVKARDVGIIFLIARCWDAINDFIMASIVEKTNTRWGKLRPYLLFSPIPIAIVTILTFSAPHLVYHLKLVYVAVTYILWGMVYTVSDIPYWGLSAAMTNDAEERNKLISITRALTMVGMGIPILFVPIILNFYPKNDPTGYLVSAIVISVIGCGLLSLGYFGTKERVVSSNNQYSMRENFSILIRNVPLLLILFSSVLGFSRNMSQTAGNYIANHIYFDPKMITVLGGIILLGVVISIVLTPYLTKYISKKNLFILSSLYGMVIYFILYFTGYNNIYIVSLLLFLSSFSSGFSTVLQTAMIADTVDYLEWKTGRRLEALCFSGQTFVSKLNSALTAFVMGIVLDHVHFIEQGPLDQGLAVKEGIFDLVSIIPAIGCLISIIPLLFYTLNESKHELVLKELAKRREPVLE